MFNLFTALNLILNCRFFPQWMSYMANSLAFLVLLLLLPVSSVWFEQEISSHHGPVAPPAPPLPPPGPAPPHSQGLLPKGQTVNLKAAEARKCCVQGRFFRRAASEV